MKRKISLALLLVIICSLFLTACEKDVDKLNYQVNSADTIYIGALLPHSAEYKSLSEKFTEGLEFASKTASKINIDKAYSLEIVFADSADLNSAYKEFTEKKVVGIIACGVDNPTTENIINKFKATDIPLVFADNYSKLIFDTDNAYSISISDPYIASCVVNYLKGEGSSKGAVVSLSEDEQSLDFLDLFESTAKSNSLVITRYMAKGKNANYNPKSIVSMDYEFVFLKGSIVDSVNVLKELKNAGFEGRIIFSEVMDKTMLYSDCQGVVFVSKFAYDDDNYIGSDFINVYSETMSTSTSDTNSAISYAYDAYMLMYEALHSFSTGEDDPLSAVKGNKKENSDAAPLSITVNDVLNSLNEIFYLGVTDEISFDEGGINHVEFVYINEVDGESALLLNKYKYSE